MNKVAPVAAAAGVAIASFLLVKKVIDAKATPVAAPSNSALPSITTLSPGGMRVLSTAATGLQSLSGAEKVALFSDLRNRLVVEGAKVPGAESMEFVNKVSGRSPAKASEAVDVLYGANMGLGLAEHAILVRRTPDGKTSVLAVPGDGWPARVQPGSPWSLFLRPGEARLVAGAAGVPVKDKSRGTKRALAPTAAGASLQLAKSGVFPLALTEPVASVSELSKVLPGAGFAGGDKEAIATTAAGDLPNGWKTVRDAFDRADTLYAKAALDRARNYAGDLAPAITPLRESGYALASAQIQALLVKIGATELAA